ncbi:MAG: DUF1326 domain-containing protein [Bryobacteraceae bacterium]
MNIRQSLLVLCLASSVALAADLPSANSLHGYYVEARTADVYTGACFANGETGITGDLAVMGWKIDRGSWNGVSLDGLSVVGVVRATTTLGDPMVASNPARAVLILDERATLDQRMALQGFAKHMGKGLLSDVVRVETQPISFDVENGNIHSRNVKLTAGKVAAIETRPLDDDDKICRHEEVYYDPLTDVQHAMPAFTKAQSYAGDALGTTWSYPGKRSAFVGTFQVTE